MRNVEFDKKNNKKITNVFEITSFNNQIKSKHAQAKEKNNLIEMQLFNQLIARSSITYYRQQQIYFSRKVINYLFKQANNKHIKKKQSINQKQENLQQANQNLKRILIQNFDKALQNLLQIPSNQLEYVKTYIKFLKIFLETIQNCINNS
ncbi:hypothetical protein TTHERM_001100429 (macronuclear) [Tetrahymena thermophila SB210]|uniref:Uncharacterized protein n=1 Tax=Tetrahymena thermophila (strain SB210) TaxID=312017 RepID=W7WZ07_TETTS|nr:hypothetical protein TTHERM_001100429 [Tetrahymena thermophila SB210]EWS72150.1 hypothetical protein TTHERM_001100429 [Tetrahymena thermophila SB210]|eukprot:XP_012655312.1 hypothetical protein TTHERM_001100429 [Tetrahymena thermophila SB210]